MTSNKELEAGLKAMAEDFHLPGGGRMKLSRLAADHLGWFHAAERRGTASAPSAADRNRADASTWRRPPRVGRAGIAAETGIGRPNS